MLTLAFESSAKAASVALVRDGSLISQYSQCSGLTHSRTLLPMAEDLLKNAELTLQDVDLFAVAHGPGSFTGIRIGVSTVKGLAWACDKPCVGVSTLEAMAWHGLAAGGLVCPVMDARRSQVYNALFEIRDGAPVRLTGDRPISLEELAEELRALATGPLPGGRRGGSHRPLPGKGRSPLPHGAGESAVAERLGRGHGRPGQDPRRFPEPAARVPAAEPGRAGTAGAARMENERAKMKNEFEARPHEK